jgi:endonuclease/exonuclease/phosphatase family metal-dependent hydrolase
MVRIASFNVENLFSRPKVFDTDGGWQANRPILDAYYEVNILMAQPVYSDADRARMLDLLLVLEIYVRNPKGAIRKNDTRSPKWAWLRKNRGTFDREPQDTSKDVEIVAEGRDQWLGWVELAKEAVNETSTRMTACVVQEVNADIQAIVEAEDRPSLHRFNKELLGDQFQHVMLVDGNDERGIDVGIMTRAGFEIETIRSNVDTPDGVTGNPLFSRDCAQYTVTAPGGGTIQLLVNHFKSQSGGGGEKRKRQANEVRRIVDELVGRGERVVVLGDFNEGPAAGGPPPNLTSLFDAAGPLASCYDVPGFDVGKRPGTFDACSLRNRLDYILVSKNLVGSVTGGGVFRRGLWGSRKTRPTNWETYGEMTASEEGASDHAAVYIDLSL